MSNFFQFCIIKQSRASKCRKFEFLSNEEKIFWTQNSNSWLKTAQKTSLSCKNWWNVVVTRADLEIGATLNSKFSKFDWTPKFHLFFWLENTPYSGGKNKPAKPHFPYKTGIIESHFRDKSTKELLSSFKGQSKCTRRT